VEPSPISAPSAAFGSPPSLEESNELQIFAEVHAEDKSDDDEEAPLSVENRFARDVFDPTDSFDPRSNSSPFSSVCLLI
jgi:hypothetical protein